MTPRKPSQRFFRALALEPRILLDAVEVWDVPDAPSHLRVKIQYRLARTGAPGRMNVNVQLEN